MSAPENISQQTDEAGAGLWIPLLFNPGLINPTVRLGSIDYQLTPTLAPTDGHMAFTSVWCFFSALMSILLLWIIRDASALKA